MNPSDIDRILADFRRWLEQQPDETPVAPPSEPIDLAALVRQFTALRQEVNLQTRASRSQMEQNATTLEQLGQALDELREGGGEVDEDVIRAAAIRPLLKTLLDARDALALARHQVARTRQSLEAADEPQPGFWSRLFGAPKAGTIPQYRNTLESLASGYAMSLQRIDRALEQHGLERITAVGSAFDPETMEVVEVVKEPGRAASEVLEEVRPGYRWNGQLFRPAHVRVARPS
jgi:molecular chaperone GrpE